MAGNVPVKHYKTSEILSKFSRLAQTSQYYVYLAPLTEIKSGGLTASGARQTLKELLEQRGVDSRFIGENLGMLCNEASLPGNSFATSEMNTDFPGVTQKFPYRKIYNDIQLTFYVDDEYKVIKFFEGWMSFIASPFGLGQAIYEGSGRASFRFNYPDAYKCNIYVTKFNKDASIQSSISYRFVNAFPIDITTMPVTYDSSDILKCTVSFSYDRYIFDPINETATSAETVATALPPPSTSGGVREDYMIWALSNRRMIESVGTPEQREILATADAMYPVGSSARMSLATKAVRGGYTAGTGGAYSGRPIPASLIKF